MPKLTVASIVHQEIRVTAQGHNSWLIIAQEDWREYIVSLSSKTSSKLFQEHRHIVIFALIQDITQATSAWSSHCRLCSHPWRPSQAISDTQSDCRLCSHQWRHSQAISDTHSQAISDAQSDCRLCSPPWRPSQAISDTQSHCRLCSHPWRHSQAISDTQSDCRLCSALLARWRSEQAILPILRWFLIVYQTKSRVLSKAGD